MLKNVKTNVCFMIIQYIENLFVDFLKNKIQIMIMEIITIKGKVLIECF